MAATQLLATGTTAASTADITILDGASVAVGLKGVENGASVKVELKDDAGAYNVIGGLDYYKPSTLLSGPATYRLSRSAGPACGIFSA